MRSSLYRAGRFFARAAFSSLIAVFSIRFSLAVRFALLGICCKRVLENAEGIIIKVPLQMTGEGRRFDELLYAISVPKASSARASAGAR